ncbi:MAG TPA: rhomboid family intramembrane serine protease [Terriglobales bacterium]|nr:rhomboid family intramembrane serine protease [Terriglobales bacterium]
MNRGQTISLSLPPFTKAVKWLVLINAGMLLLLSLLKTVNRGVGELVESALSLVPFLVLRGWVFQLITYSFLHAGFWHLVGNMFGLWMFGSQFEMEWGRKKFLEFYFFCVVGAALTTIAVSYTGWGGISPGTPTVGASGGVLGILMAYGLIYGDNEIMLFPIPIRIRAKYFVAGLALLTILGALGSASQRGENVAYIAHVGGLLFGFVYVKFVPRRGLMFGTSERYFGIRNSYYRWKRKRAARKFEVYMKEHDRKVTFDEHGNYIPPEDDKKNGGSKSGWVN